MEVNPALNAAQRRLPPTSSPSIVPCTTEKAYDGRRRSVFSTPHYHQRYKTRSSLQTSFGSTSDASEAGSLLLSRKLTRPFVSSCVAKRPSVDACSACTGLVYSLPVSASIETSLGTEAYTVLIRCTAIARPKSWGDRYWLESKFLPRGRGKKMR